MKYIVLIFIPVAALLFSSPSVEPVVSYQAAADTIPASEPIVIDTVIFPVLDALIQDAMLQSKSRLQDYNRFDPEAPGVQTLKDWELYLQQEYRKYLKGRGLYK